MSSSTTRSLNGADGTSASESSIPVPYSIPTDFTLHWQSKAPRYKNDFDIYIWQPYRKPPLFSYVRFHIFNTEAPRALKMLVFFSGTQSLCAFRSQHQKLAPQRSANDVWSPVDEYMRSLSAVFNTIISDMVEFLRSSLKEMTRVVRSTYTELCPISTDERDRDSRVALIHVSRRFNI